MISLFAIVSLTLKTTIRSKIFIFLIFLLVLAVLVIPHSVLDDGTATGFIRVSIQYCVGAITFILSLSTIWVSCFMLSRDVESHQIHMLVSKPISRVKIWLGKCFGVILIHVFLLFVSAIMVYIAIMYNFNRKNFSQEEKEQIRNEVLIGRRVYLPQFPDIDSLVKKVYEERLKLLEKNTQTSADIGIKSQLPAGFGATELYQIRKEVISKLGEVPPGPAGVRSWDYKGIRAADSDMLYFRYRLYIDSVTKKDQRETGGLWFIKIKATPEVIEELKKESGDKKAPPPETVFVPLTPSPESIKGGVFKEFSVPFQGLGVGRDISIAFGNFDPEMKPVYFQFADGPKLLVRVTGFTQNYLRAMAVSAMNLIFLAGLGCAAGGFLSMPTAVFSVVCYILLGVFSNYLLDLEKLYEEGMEEKFVWSLESIHDYVGKKVSRVILATTVPVQKLAVSDQLADGELIEFSHIAGYFFYYIVLRGGPVFLLGIYLYRRREMGAVIRK